ncbi:hypothetical protein [Candidatus Viadribacter manganicus]|uniref:Lipoprotein n=1 Tax=Candidatus Viadribacter manganicus TaxID=1759059 RepID=A0A1B1AFS1_9PROT|nr:hypothetical protein [Candidatus Viadribacter manganicus]ANP45400.1 hypothetical protein ATE48_05455 [Candidatus Viadribacter manganicus]
MRIAHAISASLFFALAACGQAAAPTEADAQTADAATQTGDVTAAERAAILAALNMHANAQGQVENECGERVTPRFDVADIGSGPGRVIAYTIGGGPNMLTCYGDGALTIFMRNQNGAWGEIWQGRPGGAIVLSTQHNSGNDIATGGPGFSFPVSQWNGTTYIATGRTVSDSALGDARFIPN